jgi:hypothetical protein
MAVLDSLGNVIIRDTEDLILELERDLDGYNILPLREKEVREFLQAQGIKFRYNKNLMGKVRGLNFTRFINFIAEPNPRLSFKVPVGKPVIEIDKNLSQQEKVWAAMHEYCHAVYHRNILKPDEITTRQIEFQANVIGVIAVIPSYEMMKLSQRNTIDIPFLMKTFHVPKDLASFRLYDIVLAISHPSFAKLVEQGWKARGYTKDTRH